MSALAGGRERRGGARGRAALGVALACCTAGCAELGLGPPGGDAGARDPAASAPAANGKPRGSEHYGKIVPRKASSLTAPANILKLKGWTSRSGSIKLETLVDDGQQVEAGQEVARFEFDHSDALDWLKKRIAEAQASADSTRARIVDDTLTARGDADVKRLAAERATLDTERGTMISERELSLLRIEAERATVVADSAERLTTATRARAASEVAVEDSMLGEWKDAMRRYEMYKGQTRVLAPHAGVVRHGFLQRQRRKVQMADNLRSGTPFAFVARDQALAVEIYVPEHRVRQVAMGQQVTVRLPDDEHRVVAQVAEIAPFPQEIGFLRGDDELPDAREKAYVVIAEVSDPPAFLSSGVEVRVALGDGGAR